MRARVRSSAIAVDDAEQDDAERQRQCREFMAVERREGVEVVGQDRSEALCACAAMRQTGPPDGTGKRGIACATDAFLPHRFRIVSGISVPLRGSVRRDTARNDLDRVSAVRHAARESRL